jgi:DNA topoisomerase-3
MSKTLIVTEKPSVARDLARVLGIAGKGPGHFLGQRHGQEFQITWAVGHLVGISEPEVMNASWKQWNRQQLPMLPKKWSLSVLSAGQAQFQILKSLFKQKNLNEVICATDAGREGELIFRYIAEACSLSKPVKRLWISSLTDQSILKGMADLQNQSQFDHLYYSARCRSRADWLVGMNFTRYYTLSTGKLLSVGRVQTPTLFLIAKRTKEIASFKPEAYFELISQFSHDVLPGFYEAGLLEIVNRPNNLELLKLDEKQEIEEAAEGTTRRRKYLKLKSLEACNSMLLDLASGRSSISDIKTNRKSIPPPELFDLTTLQREANRRFHFSADKTLKIAQALYEKHKVLSYPRTDSKYLTADVAVEMLPLLRTFAEEFPGIHFNFVAPGKRYVDASKVSDHHAIIPVGKGLDLSGDEKKIFELVKIRTMQIFTSPREIEECLITTEAYGQVGQYNFHTTALREIVPGWSALDSQFKKKTGDHKLEISTNNERLLLPPSKSKVKRKQDSGHDSETSVSLPPWLEVNLAVVGSFSLDRKTTLPPKAYTDGTLLSAMENCGRSLADHELKDALKLHGLGTPATRAQTIELLLTRKYVIRSGKYLLSTPLGFELLDVVHPSLASVELTASFEKGLELVRQGKVSSAEFEEKINVMITRILPQIENCATNIVDKTCLEGEPPMTSLDSSKHVRPGSVKLPSRISGLSSNPEKSVISLDPALQIKVRITEGKLDVDTNFTKETPKISTDHSMTRASRNAYLGSSNEDLSSHLERVLNDTFLLRNFRPGQREVSSELVKGRDALVLMPTGGGKSLCFQIPGLIRKGLAIVVSPLLALMDDQVRRLLSYGIPAFAMHSGQNREEMHAVWERLSRGELKFLFVSPERMANLQFRQKLLSYQLSLMAIDEAHCVSHWGHDFRPDYREIANWIKDFRPTPVVALTATATPKVRDDIAKVLELNDPVVHLGGFFRDNLAIEVRDLSKSDRIFEVKKWLADKANVPAIVYSSSRKDTEIYSQALGRNLKSAHYHAGMNALDRGRVQKDFQEGKLDVVVATVAFGMGVDKSNIRSVVHLALSASVESYYQEIGRAGRDGMPSRCLLLKSREDRETLEWMYRESYPNVKELEKLLKKISNHPDLEFEKSTHLDKLTIHGAIERLVSGKLLIHAKSNWKASYLAQADSRMQQIRAIEAFASQTSTCRMQKLIAYFGQDDVLTCQKCDVCLGKTTDDVTGEDDFVGHVIDYLSRFGRTAYGKLKSDLAKGHKMAHSTFERVIQGMVEGGLCEVMDESFVTGGKKIFYRTVGLGPHSRELSKNMIGNLEETGSLDVTYDFDRKSRGYAKKSSKSSLKVKRFIARRKSKKKA